jgi:O-antigen ligase
LLNISTTEKPFFGVSFRLQIWYSILDLIYQSPLTGYGIGDITELLNIRYNKNELQGLNAHNQYLQFILHHGIIIFLFLFLFVYKLIKQCVLNKNSVLLFSWIVLLSFSFTESILNRQWGVILFAFIVNYSIYSNNLSSENNSK